MRFYTDSGRVNRHGAARRPVARGGVGRWRWRLPHCRRGQLLLGDLICQVPDCASGRSVGPSETTTFPQIAGARWALAAADTSKDVSLAVTIQCKDVAAAKRMATSIRSLAVGVRETPRSRPCLSRPEILGGHRACDGAKTKLP